MALGEGDGVGDGLAVGDGDAVGAGVGSSVGAAVGAGVGSGVGAGVGAAVGAVVGSGVGAGVGDGEALGDADADGEDVGDADGAAEAVGARDGGGAAVGSDDAATSCVAPAVGGAWNPLVPVPVGKHAAAVNDPRTSIDTAKRRPSSARSTTRPPAALIPSTFHHREVGPSVVKRASASEDAGPNGPPAAVLSDRAATIGGRETSRHGELH